MWVDRIVIVVHAKDHHAVVVSVFLYKKKSIHVCYVLDAPIFHTAYNIICLYSILLVAMRNVPTADLSVRSFPFSSRQAANEMGKTRKWVSVVNDNVTLVSLSYFTHIHLLHHQVARHMMRPRRLKILHDQTPQSLQFSFRHLRSFIGDIGWQEFIRRHGPIHDMHFIVGRNEIHGLQ